MYKVLYNKRINKNSFEIKIEAPLVIKNALPGQFVIVMGKEDSEKIPLSIYDYDKENGLLYLIYQVVGASTLELSTINDYIYSITGPLGKPNEICMNIDKYKDKKIVYVGGGIGIAPVYMQVKYLKENGINVDVIYGCRTKDLMIIKDKLEDVCKNIAYVTDDGTTTESSTNEYYKDYLPSEKITEHEEEMGKRDLDSSSLAVTCTTYAIYNQDKMEDDGTLDEQGMTFDEFVAANSDPVEQEVPDAILEAVSDVTGISTDNITIVAYEIPMFQYSSGSALSITDIIQIVLALLIFAMLGFVVFRSIRTEEEEPVEEELTIDDLIASTQEEEEELEDIGYTEKSEARILIEKFVDENPEAVANLLRNWLNEDWG